MKNKKVKLNLNQDQQYVLNYLDTMIVNTHHLAPIYSGMSYNMENQECSLFFKDLIPNIDTYIDSVISNFADLSGGFYNEGLKNVRVIKSLCKGDYNGTTSNGTFSVSRHILIWGRENRFVRGVTDRLGFKFGFPRNMNFNKPFNIIIDWHSTSKGPAIGKMHFYYTILKTSDFNKNKILFNSKNEETHIAFDCEQYTNDYKRGYRIKLQDIDVSKFNPEDTIYMSLIRYKKNSEDTMRDVIITGLWAEYTIV